MRAVQHFISPWYGRYTSQKPSLKFMGSQPHPEMKSAHPLCPSGIITHLIGMHLRPVGLIEQEYSAYCKAKICVLHRKITERWSYALSKFWKQKITMREKMQCFRSEKSIVILPRWIRFRYWERGAAGSVHCSMDATSMHTDLVIGIVPSVVILFHGLKDILEKLENQQSGSFFTLSTTKIRMYRTQVRGENIRTGAKSSSGPGADPGSNSVRNNLEHVRIRSYLSKCPITFLQFTNSWQYRAALFQEKRKFIVPHTPARKFHCHPFRGNLLS